MKPETLPPTFDSLLKLAQHLRSPAGCPWDREQTLATLKDDLQEEVQEIFQAIDKQDAANLQEELGDTLFCLALLTAVAMEDNQVTPVAIFSNCIKKITDRHSWVFGQDTAGSAQEAIALWKKNKSHEKK
ncbi:MAG TPA: MazG nucleotide pyrophosphohydrolase domain-containing protein [bacterium]|nr:MazG nucleotide pyrophosphohydrolase domain-containing protein [bacterium]